MVSKMTVARIPPAMTTVPADIRNPLHQQPAGRSRRRRGTKKEEIKGRGGQGGRMREKWKDKSGRRERVKRRRTQGKMEQEVRRVKRMMRIKKEWGRIKREQGGREAHVSKENKMEEQTERRRRDKKGKMEEGQEEWKKKKMIKR